MGDGCVACEVDQERVDHRIDSHQQGPHQIIASFVVGLGEAAHDFRAQEARELMEGALCKKVEASVWVGDTTDKLAGVFQFVLEAVRKEGAGK